MNDLTMALQWIGFQRQHTCQSDAHPPGCRTAPTQRQRRLLLRCRPACAQPHRPPPLLAEPACTAEDVHQAQSASLSASLGKRLLSLHVVSLCGCMMREERLPARCKRCACLDRHSGHANPQALVFSCVGLFSLLKGCMPAALAFMRHLICPAKSLEPAALHLGASSNP